MIEPDFPIGPDGVASRSVIRAAFPCFGCRYNLRGATLDGVCPECGTPIRRSLEHGWLRFADVAWLRRVRLGVDLTLATGLLSVLLTGAFTVSFMAQIARNINQPPDPRFMSGWTLAMTLIIGGAVLVVVWFLTSPEPPGSGSAPARRSPLARWIIGIYGFGFLTSFGYLAVAPAFFDPTAVIEFSAVRVLAGFIWLAGNIGGAIALFLLMVYLRRIARRDIDRGLSKLMTFLIWGLGILAGLGFLFVGASMAWMLTGGAAQLQALSTLPATGTMPAGSAVKVTMNTRTAAGSVTTQFAVPLSSGPFSGWAGPTSAATTQPVAIGVGGAPPPPAVAAIAGSLMMLMVPMLGVECFAFVWIIALIVAVFWFRRMLSRSIEMHETPDMIVGAL